MRAAPPAATLAWLLTAVDATDVLSVDVVHGGSTSAMHRVGVRRADGSALTVVLRRYVVAEVLADAPSIAVQETTALRLVAGSPVPTPLLLAADPHGRDTDAPATVMSFLDGTPIWEPRRRRDWLAQIADAMTQLHTLKLPDNVGVPAISRYNQVSYAPPNWAQHPRAWEHAVELFHGPVPDTDVGFVHRDFQPGNLLWRRNELAGVVDWQAACRGPASIDVGQCRMDMLLYDANLADELRTTWERYSGRTFHPWADVMSIIGTLDSLRRQPPGPAARAALETAVARAVNDLSL